MERSACVSARRAADPIFAVPAYGAEVLAAVGDELAEGAVVLRILRVLPVQGVEREARVPAPSRGARERKDVQCNMQM